MASIHAFEQAGQSRRAQLLPVTAGRRGDYALGDVARRLRIENLTTATIIQHLRLLHDQERMPAPSNHRRYAGRILRGAAAIHKGSLWDAARFDQWLERRVAPTEAERAAASEALRRQLAGNARSLAGEGRQTGEDMA